ncbi:MAG: AAA family ATPase [Candidatus Omnitrophota bacterium]
MNYLEKVEIKGFWGNRDISISFNPDVNFLIGVNGSGKTTVINLIAAALNADFPTLDRLPFNSMQLQLREVNGNSTPSIEVEKKPQERSPYPSISFSIKSKETDKAVNYSLDQIEEGRIYRTASHEYYHSYPARHSQRLGKIHYDIIEHLSGLVNISWLSIHRTTASYRSKEERSFESTIDQKLSELSNEFIKYFSLLDKQSAIEIDRFQQTIFLSLLSDESESEVFSILKSLDPDNEKQELIKIFKLFRLDENEYLKSVERHFDSYSKLFQKLSNSSGFRLEDLSVLIGTRRIHSIVQDWSKLTEKQKDIYKPRNTFLNVVNSLMQRKEIKINEKNELEVKTQSKKIFPLKFLSSGEKQLLIILGEALLQQSAPWIYIADEPELSLHVTWQESLVRNLRNVNPKAQIIFATHSPDIVSNFHDRVFDMEKVVS